MSDLPTCPKCGGANDAHTPADVIAVPEPGDLSICAYCLAMNEFTDDLNLVEMSLKDQMDALNHPELGPVIKRARLQMQQFFPNDNMPKS